MTDKTDPHCTYCDNTNSDALYQTEDIFGDHWVIHCCNSCSARFLAPMPTANQLSNAYSAEYYGQGQGKDKFGGTIEKILDAF